jgi:hypothetical protein
LTNGCAWNAVSAFANPGRAVAHVRGSYVPRPDIQIHARQKDSCYSIVAWLGVSTRSGHVEAELTAHDQSLAVDGTEIIAV